MFLTEQILSATTQKDKSHVYIDILKSPRRTEECYKIDLIYVTCEEYMTNTDF